MATAIRLPFRPPAVPGQPRYVHNDSFDEADAEERYEADALADDAGYEVKYMPDEATRDHARRMHYAAHRLAGARSAAEQKVWRQRYYRLRDRIVLGNRKLVYRAVRQRMALADRADDLIGECHIVLIQAVAAYNPWLGIRFSTYAFTCLVRALARLAQRHAADRLAHSLPLEALPEGEPRNAEADESAAGFARLDEFLRDDHPLLSAREKTILMRRFRLSEEAGVQTLEKVGRDLGLSKERVRQVQASALGKLRQALLAEKKN